MQGGQRKCFEWGKCPVKNILLQLNEADGVILED